MPCKAWPFHDPGERKSAGLTAAVCHAFGRHGQVAPTLFAPDPSTPCQFPPLEGLQFAEPVQRCCNSLRSGDDEIPFDRGETGGVESLCGAARRACTDRHQIPLHRLDSAPVPRALLPLYMGRRIADVDRQLRRSWILPSSRRRTRVPEANTGRLRHRPRSD